jgi:hypothetical protein
MASLALPAAPLAEVLRPLRSVSNRKDDKKRTFPGPSGRATHGSPALAYGEALALGKRVTAIPGDGGRIIHGPRMGPVRCRPRPGRCGSGEAHNGRNAYAPDVGDACDARRGTEAAGASLGR